jgi:hypothetical protein
VKELRELELIETEQNGNQAVRVKSIIEREEREEKKRKEKKRKEKKRKEKKKIEVLHSLFRGHPKHVYLTAM